MNFRRSDFDVTNRINTTDPVCVKLEVAGSIVHFTGYERPVATIRVPHPIFKLVGSLLGTADIIAQMSDRCYLEKCRDRLYPEFVTGGIARRRTEQGEEVVFSSPED